MPPPLPAVVIHLDLEFIVPREDRQRRQASLLFNPARPGHEVLGGVALVEQGGASTREVSAWAWRDGGEAGVLRAFYDAFGSAWESMRGNPAERADVIVMGIGIARSDLPALVLRSLRRGIASEDALVERFLKARVVDLAQAGAAFVPNRRPHLYPATKAELAARFGLRAPKTGMGVWDLHDRGAFEEIERGTRAEVEFGVALHRAMRQAAPR